MATKESNKKKKDNTKGQKRLTKQEKEKRKKKRIILVIVEVVVLIALIVGLYIITQFDKMEGTDINPNDIKTNENDEDGEGNKVVPEHYRNVALFGVDSRNGALGKGTLSDSIIVASINEQTKEIRLVSVYRDTYLNLSNDKYSKANSAYSKGGPKQAISMLNMNLDLYITEYVTVGFAALVDTIDALGGIEIEVDEEEFKHLNNYQIGTSEALGRSYTPLQSTGLQTLDGMQATSYCRIRYTKGDDFRRTERQREVIEQIVLKAKTASPTALNEIINKTFSQIATSLDLNEILKLAVDIKDYNIVETTGFPFEGHIATGNVPGAGSCVMPVDLETNVTLLHEFLFDKKDYIPTNSVKEYSARIRQDTGK